MKRSARTLLVAGAGLATASACALILASMPGTARGEPGGTILNGTTTQPNHIRTDSQAAAGIPQNFFTGVGFLFEPESPYASLKSVPTWNEIEQLLDNPYAVTPDPITPGNFDGFPSYRSTIVRRPSFAAPGATLRDPGPPLPQLLVHPLNYNPTTGEEMRLLNPGYPGGEFSLPDELFQDLARDPTGNTWNWTFKAVTISPGAERVTGPEIDYNGPVKADPFTCVDNLEVVPPEGTQLCGLDPGEPNYFGFGNLPNRTGYSTPAVPLAGPGVRGRNVPVAQRVPEAVIPPGKLLFDPTRGFIRPRSQESGTGGLRKPSLRVPEAGGRPNHPNYLVNRDPNDVTPSNENDFVRDRNVAIALGKALFWDMQVGSDGVQSCGTCHFNGTGTDTRTRNQINPNHLGGDLTFQLMQPNERDLVANDFPLHKLADPDVAGDPACTTPIVANVSNVTPALDHPVDGDRTVCDARNIVSDVNDVVSSMGVHFGVFADIAAIGSFVAGVAGVSPVAPDVRAPVVPGTTTADPIPGFAGVSGNDFRRVEPRNTPTMQAAAFNFDNFWDGRARHDFNGGSVFGAADPQSHVFVARAGVLEPTRQLIKFASLASLATGPALSEFEMSFLGRSWPKIGKKLLQAGVTPLANQLVSPTDSVLGPYSNQPGNPSPSPLCSPAALAARADGKPGLCTSYNALIRATYYPALWQNVNQHLDGCYTDGNAAVHPNQCAAGSVAIPVLDASGAVVNSAADPFDNYVLSVTAGPAAAADTNQFTQMEGNFSLFWGLAVNLWVQILVPDDTPFDQFLELNPDAFMSLGDTSERLLVDDLLNCTSPTQRNCFRELGNFKRDSDVVAFTHATAEGGGGATATPAGGTRTPGSNEPDPLLGMDIFFASNLSLKNPNFRSARCGACHNMPTLTDHTMPFTFKAQLPDFASEFTAAAPGVELLTEPLGRMRTISGFLLESEIAENGQDAIERRFINQSIVPNPADGYAYPDGVFNPPSYVGAGQAFIDNGVYNLGVRPIDNDIGRGGTDAFGWPLSLASLMMKNLGGPAYEPNVPANPLTGAPGRGSGPMLTFDPALGPEGGLFEESAQDQQLNPGGTDEPRNALLPPWLAPFVNGIPVGDAQPELDEPFAGINTLTDVALLEGFIDVIGPVNPGAVKNEALNMGKTELMGTWPTVNRVIRDGAFKAPQLRNVELTGPYFHNGGTLTLRQVIDFYTRGGDFPITNAAHRDFLLVNLDLEAQSNLSEEEKVALVDFLLELTDERNRFDRAPFDHPQVIVPVDGAAPDNTFGRAGLLADARFRDVPAVGAAGQATPEPTFLNVTKVRVAGDAAQRGSAACDYAGGVVSHYCH
jgi:cytochrome c peroxidase